MGYQGYLIKIADSSNSNDWFIIPPEFIEEKSYKATYSTMDENSTRNANAVLDRNVLSHRVAHCEMQIRSLTDTQVGQLFGANGGISTRYENELEKSVYADMFIPELNDYITVKCYVPDIDFVFNHVRNTAPYGVRYEPFTLEFIGY